MNSKRVVTRALLATAAFMIVAGCGPGTPSVAQGREALHIRIDDGNERRLRLASFEKSDGQLAEVMGVKSYVMMFRATARFADDAMFGVGAPLISEGSHITTGAYQPAPRGFSWNDFLSASQGERRARRGDMLALNGEISFERRESGWVATGVRFDFAQDSSGRSR